MDNNPEYLSLLKKYRKYDSFELINPCRAANLKSGCTKVDKDFFSRKALFREMACLEGMWM
jgi:hypothetical protein